MECRNHPGAVAVARCTGCAEPFCANCLVDLGGQNYCGACKVMAIQGRAPVYVQPTKTSTEARDALILAIFGLFCFGIILEPWALVKASNAKKAIDADPRLGGRGMASAATVIATIGLVVWALGLVLRIAAINRM